MFQIERKSIKQEYIPVVCVLPALVAILGGCLGMSAQRRGVCREDGCLPRGGVSAQRRDVCPEEGCLPRGGVSAQRRDVCPEEGCLPRGGVSALGYLPRGDVWWMSVQGLSAEGMSAQGGCLPRGCLPGDVYPDPPPKAKKQTPLDPEGDTPLPYGKMSWHTLWKHYLPATTVAGGKNFRKTY